MKIKLEFKWLQIKIKFCSMSTNKVASHSDRLSNFPCCNWHVNQSHVCNLLVLYEMVEWFVNILFIYFILNSIVTHKFHNFYVYLISNHFILKFFSHLELVKLNSAKCIFQHDAVLPVRVVVCFSSWHCTVIVAASFDCCEQFSLLMHWRVYCLC